MPRLNKSRFAVLGALALSPKSGYDVKKLLEGFVSPFWSESYGQIYPILRQLEADGAASVLDDSTSGARPRKVYTITPKGRTELEAWLRSPADPPQVRHELMLKVFLGRLLPPEDLVPALQAHRDWAARSLGEWHGLEENLIRERGSDPSLPYWLMALRAGVRLMAMRVDWAEECIATLHVLARKRRATPARKARKRPARTRRR